MSFISGEAYFKPTKNYLQCRPWLDSSFGFNSAAKGPRYRWVHREDLGSHLPLVWRSLQEGRERSNALDSFSPP